jgi:hypothetical protein
MRPLTSCSFKKCEVAFKGFSKNKFEISFQGGRSFKQKVEQWGTFSDYM